MATTSFTCLTCLVAFGNAEDQRTHYKTDWHRYNLKRKVAELPPVSVDTFRDRAVHAQQSRVAENGKTVHNCKVCHKRFASRNTYASHVNSKKHAATVRKQGGDVIETVTTDCDPSRQQESICRRMHEMSVEDPRKSVSKLAEVETTADDDAWSDLEEGQPLAIDACLFCSQTTSGMDENLNHMVKEHRFFIPYAEYVSDLNGLMAYLAEKVGVGNMCLWCNDRGKAFYSVEAVQQHMRHMNHCKLHFERDTCLEYSDYYDYSSSYPEGDQRDPNDEIEIDVMDGTGYELVLPSGATIGHRSLFRYYKQKLRPIPPKRCGKAVRAAMSRYASLGWTGTTGVAAIRKARAIRMMHQWRSARMMKIGVKANRLQKYLRQQNPI